MITEAAGKVGVYLALLLAIGSCAARWLLVQRGATNLGSGGVVRIEASLAAVIRRAAVVLALALVARLLLHTAAAFGWDGLLSWDNVRVIAIASRWGGGWQFQIAAALILVTVTWVSRLRASAGWLAATASTAGAAATIPLLGHAAGAAWRVTLHAVHVIGGGLWLGTLGAVVFVPHADERTALLRAFAPLALTGAALLVVTGITASWLYLGSFGALGSPYGGTLVVKVALVLAVAACGYLNWQHFRRQEPGAPPTVWLEVILAVAVVLMTSVLTELPHP